MKYAKPLAASCFSSRLILPLIVDASTLGAGGNKRKLAKGSAGDEEEGIAREGV